MAELCAGLGIDLVVYTTQWRGAFRYLALGARTVALLVRRRPRVLMVQNPSLVLAVLGVLARHVLRYRLVVDAHNEAVQPFKNRQPWIASLSRWVIRCSDLTIVTNRYLADDVTRQGGRPFTLPDRVPSPPPVPKETPLAGTFNVVLIATFDSDEPCAEVFTAVSGTDIDLYVTGNQRKLSRSAAAAAPPNVHFTGFLEEAAYWSLLQAADAVVDLTLKSNCLVCGSYEALALTKPMLLSDSPASRELFGTSAVFTDNTSADIRHALTRVRNERTALEEAAKRRRAELRDHWNSAAAALRVQISSLPENSRAEMTG
ncbi:MAG: glycosyltransferase [Terriglobales bacterium]